MPAPELPAGLRHRPLQVEDAAALAELRFAIEEVDRFGDHADVADCTRELGYPSVELADASALVFDGAKAVAYVLLSSGSGLDVGPFLRGRGGVHPTHRGRGIGTALVRWVREVAAAKYVTLLLTVQDADPAAVVVAERTGLVPGRRWADLTRDLAVPVTPAPVPDGLRLLRLGPGYDPARWDGPLRAAHNAAFADHWGSPPISAQSWVHGRTGNSNFRPEASVATMAPDGEVAGYVLGFEYDSATARTGVRELLVHTVGTVPAWRGRGVGAAMMAYVLATAASLGYERSGLSVDTRNPTGAVGVYERAGYTLERTAVVYSSRAL
ncbi:GNAT family N-acetyltransferase [Pseudonocardia sp. TRM90224]|uniref:GNAT family N-acetyltransferase n=1 Tax=Pseudonocardia sp. TRM90224 TaxID=2812678 RepID=UPI001E51D3C8|nr:GNAT family N-acetyltransferase [Pseudonocardia sp. TRM90224]